MVGCAEWVDVGVDALEELASLRDPAMQTLLPRKLKVFEQSRLLRLLDKLVRAVVVPEGKG
jgi:hypothetical protein